jgi:hypothetical protein
MNDPQQQEEARRNKRKRNFQLVAAIGSILLIIATASHIQTIVSATQSSMFLDTEAKKRQRFEEECEEAPLMKNIFRQFYENPQRPTVPLRYEDRFGRMMEDPNRGWVKKLTHMFSWEFLELAELLQQKIEAPRETKWRGEVKFPGEVKTRGGRPPKYDYLNRLLFVLEWMANTSTGNKAEFDNGYAKTSIVEDKKHILRVINEVLESEVRWPDEEERAQLSAGYNGIFEGVVGIIDATEHYYKKNSDPQKEESDYSGKAGTTTKKTLAVIDKHGLFIWVEPLANGRRNDRDQWTSCDLYMDAGKYFKPWEKVAGDGAFKGHGPNVVSYDILDTDEKALYNLAFKEVRVGVENAFGRVQMWFPLLGVNRMYWNYDEEMLELAVGAATKLHNWMIRNRGLSYNAEDNPRNFYRHMY